MKHTVLDFDPTSPSFLDGRKILLASQAGSHLFGVSTPESDQDYRYLFLPHAREVLLGQVDFGIDSNPENVTMSEGDADGSGYTLKRFLKLLGRLEMSALEMLFASQSPAALVADPVMHQIYEMREKLLAGTSSSALGHVRQIAGAMVPQDEFGLACFEAALTQIEAASARGTSRLATDMAALQALSEIDGVRFLTEAGDTVDLQTLKDMSDAQRRALLFEVTYRRFPINAPLNQVTPGLMKPLARAQSRRARHEGVDVSVKDAYHAVRLLSQVIELYQTRHLTFPRPEAPYLHDIRAGKVSLDEVQVQISTLFEKIQDLQKIAPFPEEQNQTVAEDILVDVHRRLVLGM